MIDDGRGLHVEAIRETALHKGVVAEEALTAMTDGEVVNRILAAGCTTVPQASSVSGRGVGGNTGREPSGEASICLVRELQMVFSHPP